MLKIEKQISNLIANQFPAVYREQGDQLVAFVQAYYEWLETNCQLLEVEDSAGFAVGDIVTQGPAGGEIIAAIGGKLLVLSTRLLIDSSTASANSSSIGNQITSLSTMDSQALVGQGSSVYAQRVYDANTDTYSTKTYDRSSYTQALRGADIFACMHFCDSLLPLQSSSGASTNIISASNSSINLLGRYLSEYNDIDLTVDRFIVHFKEKFLSNIEFDVATNKRLLIKNALDLYRAKGTERAIDLFFKLVYGTEARVYTPGEDLFRLSDGEYIKPIYLEVTNSPWLVESIGRIVRGAISSASGFVERYIRRRVDNNFVYILYISAIEGTFVNNEPLIIAGRSLRYDNPRVVGSLNSFEIVGSGTGFEVGDLVSIVANTGSGGIARVTGISEQTGVVDFDLVEGGWGYTVNADAIVSEKVISLSNVVIGNTSITANYFSLLEGLTQSRVTIGYNSASANLVVGDSIYFANGTANTSGVVITSSPNTASNGSLLVSVPVGNIAAIVANNKIHYSNNLLVANVGTVAGSSVGSTVMGIPSTVTLSVGAISNGSVLTVGQTVVQGNTTGLITAVDQISSSADIVIDIIRGAYAIGSNVTIGSTVTANVVNQALTVGVYSVNATFSNGYAISTSCTQVSATITGLSTGSLADFSVGTIGEPETVFLNTDLLAANNTSNVPFMSLALAAGSYGFPKAPAGNSATIGFQMLAFDDYNLGSVGTITGINPGTNYNVDPYVLVRQPYISGFGRRDLVINIDAPTGSFAIGERIVQTNANLTYIALGAANTSGFVVGENIRQGSGPETANGTITDIVTNASLIVRNVQGTFAASANVFSRISSANVVVANVTSQSIASTAKALVSAANTTVIHAKRIQFENTWTAGTQLVGQSSGTTANVVSVIEDANTLPIGLNAVVTANVVIAPGAVTSLRVVDSGFGYANGQLASFASEDGTRLGSVYLIRNGQGLSTGYWRSNKGMLSTDKYLLDSDFYQEYSYQVISRIPFDKYRNVVLDVLHVAGTKLFGAVEIDSIVDVTASYVESSIGQP